MEEKEIKDELRQICIKQIEDVHSSMLANVDKVVDATYLIGGKMMFDYELEKAMVCALLREERVNREICAHHTRAGQWFVLVRELCDQLHWGIRMQTEMCLPSYQINN